MAYGIGVGTSTNTATGDNNIDALLYTRRWADNQITFSFTNDFANDYEEENGYEGSADADHASSFSSFNSVQREAMRQWIKMFEDISNLDFIELTGEDDRNATIRIAESTASSAAVAAYAYLPSRSVLGGDMWFNPTLYDNPDLGSYPFFTFGHELGHALGLAHAHEDDDYKVSSVAMNADRDSHEFSVMTYRSYIGAPVNKLSNEYWGFSQSPMMYDIRAIQEMYGANFDTNSNGTTYSFSTTTGEMFVNGVGQGIPGRNRIFRTIWDGNGTDTYDFSNYITNLAIDLTPGGWSDLDADGNNQQAYLGDGNYARGHVFNALQFNGDSRSLIENAKAGSGNDEIKGNSARNLLHGGLGDDIASGGAGNDTLRGEGGNDSLSGNDGSDRLAGDAGNDTIYGGSGNDTAWGGENNDIIKGEWGDDSLFGNSGDDFLQGGDGKDTLNGGYGNDILDGGNGKDRLIGGAGRDIFAFTNSNQVGDEIVDFAVQDDMLAISAAGFEGISTVGMVSSQMFTLGTSAVTNSHRFIYHASSGDLFYDSDGVGNERQIKLAELDANLAVNHNHFEIV